MQTQHYSFLLLMLTTIPTMKSAQLANTASEATIDCATLLAIDAKIDTIMNAGEENAPTELPMLTFPTLHDALPFSTTVPIAAATAIAASTSKTTASCKTRRRPLLHKDIKQRLSPMGQKPKKQFACPYTGCTKSYTQAHSLTDHINIHTGEKPYICDSIGCEKRFSSPSKLRQHGLSHLAPEERPFACPYCPVRCTQAPHLQTHMHTHTGEKPYTCEECGKLFASNNVLASHLRTHSGEKPYTCTECHKSFTQKGTLNIHMRIHTGEKPYHCGICGQGFSQKHSVTNHEKHQHTEKPTTTIATNSTATSGQSA